MVAAEASGALRPMAVSAAMAMPQSWRMGRELLAMIVLLGRFVVFMLFLFWFFLMGHWDVEKKQSGFGLI
jgi:hypothetical protein